MVRISYRKTYLEIGNENVSTVYSWNEMWYGLNNCHSFNSLEYKKDRRRSRNNHSGCFKSSSHKS